MEHGSEVDFVEESFVDNLSPELYRRMSGDLSTVSVVINDPIEAKGSAEFAFTVKNCETAAYYLKHHEDLCLMKKFL